MSIFCSMNPDRKTSTLKGVARPRDKATIKRLQMYRNFKAKRDESGKVIRPAPFQSKFASGTVARVEPNRKWFGNIRVVCWQHCLLPVNKIPQIINLIWF